MQCAIIPLGQILQNVASVLCAVFIAEYSTVTRHITSVPCVYYYGHIVVVRADREQCPLLLSTYTFAGCVTGSLYHNVTGIYFLSLANRKCDLCSYET